MGIFGDAAHLLLGHIADGEHDVEQLLIGDLGQEIGLVLHGIDRCGQVFHTINNPSGRIVARGRHVEILAPPLLKKAELDHAVAHHVGVGCEALTYSAQGIFHHMVPVFLV